MPVDAYHGVPNASSELQFCVVAFLDTDKHEVRFAVSYGHLFGFAAAVVNFNRLRLHVPSNISELDATFARLRA